MSLENSDADKILELFVLDYLVTRKLTQTATSLVKEAKITSVAASALHRPGQGLLRDWWDLQFNAPTLGVNDSQAAAYAQLSAINSDGVPLNGERLKHSHSTDFRPTPQHFDAHRMSLPQPNTNHQADGQLLQSIPGGGSIAQHIQGVGINDNYNVVGMPSEMDGARNMPTNFGLGGVGFDQDTSGFLSEWGVPSTGTRGNMDPPGIRTFQSGGLDEIFSGTTILQKRPTNFELGMNQESTQQPQYQQQHQYLQQPRMASAQQLQYQQQQQNFRQLRAKQQQQELLSEQQKQQLLQEQQKQQAVNLAFAQQPQVQLQQQLLPEQQKQQLLQKQQKQHAMKLAFARQPQVQLQQQVARKMRKPTSAAEAGTSTNPVGLICPAPLLRFSIGTSGGRFLLAGNSGIAVGPNAPPLMTPGVGLPLAGGSRNPFGHLINWPIDTLGDGLLPTKQQSAKNTGSEDSVTSRKPVNPLASSTDTPVVGLPSARDSENPVGPPSTATPGEGLPSARDLAKGSET